VGACKNASKIVGKRGSEEEERSRGELKRKKKQRKEVTMAGLVEGGTTKGLTCCRGGKRKI